MLVIGSGGAGKSTLARRIAAVTGLPLVHLDRLYWRAGWETTPREEWERLVADLVAEDAWVLDGNYGGAMELRLAAADTAVFLDLPRTTCLRRAVSRALRHRGSTRDDMAPGCPDKLDREFIWWIWRYPATSRPRILTRLAGFAERGGRVVRLRSDAEVRAFVRSLEG